MERMADNLTIENTHFSGYCSFSSGIKAPIYEVFSSHALNQLLGYAKFKNSDYGNVYYRGQTAIYNTLLSSLHREYAKTQTAGKAIREVIIKIENDRRLRKDLKLDRLSEKDQSIVIECMLQHYGLKTRFLDLVDNHWVALWMGLYTYTTIKQVSVYSHYVKREIPYINLINGTAEEKDFFQYILLLAFPYSGIKSNNGISRCGQYLTVDLRQALPSTFLRPHAQHGLLAKKIVPDSVISSDFDLSETVVGIIKIRIDRAAEWLGTGKLLVQDNLFPAPAYDNGYDILISRNDIFSNPKQQIARYV